MKKAGQAFNVTEAQNFATVHFPRKETLKVFSVNRESAKEKETFRVCVYDRVGNEK
jgi:hypothetical protein